MELTPIKVRGKKRALGEQTLVNPRPKRLKEDLSQKQLAKPRRPKASRIEKSMPLEVLERIFWLSENVNLPRASLRLGRMLSGVSTLRETFLTAFGPTWEVWFGRLLHRDAVNELDESEFGGNPTFQTDLLACSWTTIDMILDCRDIWVRRNARNLSSRFHPLGDSSGVNSSVTGVGGAVEVNDNNKARDTFYSAYRTFRGVELLSTRLGVEYYMIYNVNTWIEVHRSTEIPDKLITGPWGEKDLQKLFWLVHSGAHLSPSQTWEVTLEGFRNAMSAPHAPNLTAMRLLHILTAFQEWPTHVRTEEARGINATAAVFEKDGKMTLHTKYRFIGRLIETSVA
ncbi:hypothetical protein GGR50DRAFT_377712 [Xylaria sp. CBS 124048]|nr:hypothetical protein GGR50DRAFT_377712 [Xylaria sp. CBS 124048]